MYSEDDWQYAYPVVDVETGIYKQYGLTKRQAYAKAALEGGLSYWLTAGTTTDDIVAKCIELADALIAKDQEVA